MTEQSGSYRAISQLPLHEDILEGAEAIARFMGTTRRRVFHLAEQGLIPTFKLGKRLCARKSSILKHIELLEGA